MVAEMKRIEKLKDLSNLQIKNFKFDEVDFEWLTRFASRRKNGPTSPEIVYRYFAKNRYERFQIGLNKGCENNQANTGRLARR